MKTSQKGIDLIKHFESLHDGDLTQIGPQQKMDVKGIWTAGWGHAIINKGGFVMGEEQKDLAY